jgi:hypothetical protein
VAEEAEKKPIRVGTNPPPTSNMAREREVCSKAPFLRGRLKRAERMAIRNPKNSQMAKL